MAWSGTNTASLSSNGSHFLQGIGAYGNSQHGSFSTSGLSSADQNAYLNGTVPINGGQLTSINQVLASNSTTSFGTSDPLQAITNFALVSGTSGGPFTVGFAQPNISYGGGSKTSLSPYYQDPFGLDAPNPAAAPTAPAAVGSPPLPYVNGTISPGGTATGSTSSPSGYTSTPSTAPQNGTVTVSGQTMALYQYTGTVPSGSNSGIIYWWGVPVEANSWTANTVSDPVAVTVGSGGGSPSGITGGAAAIAADTGHVTDGAYPSAQYIAGSSNGLISVTDNSNDSLTVSLFTGSISFLPIINCAESQTMSVSASQLLSADGQPAGGGLGLGGSFNPNPNNVSSSTIYFPNGGTSYVDTNIQSAIPSGSAGTGLSVPICGTPGVNSYGGINTTTQCAQGDYNSTAEDNTGLGTIGDNPLYFSNTIQVPCTGSTISTCTLNFFNVPYTLSTSTQVTSGSDQIPMCTVSPSVAPASSSSAPQWLFQDCWYDSSSNATAAGAGGEGGCGASGSCGGFNQGIYFYAAPCDVPTQWPSASTYPNWGGCYVNYGAGGSSVHLNYGSNRGCAPIEVTYYQTQCYIPQYATDSLAVGSAGGAENNQVATGLQSTFLYQGLSSIITLQSPTVQWLPALVSSQFISNGSNTAYMWGNDKSTVNYAIGGGIPTGFEFDVYRGTSASGLTSSSSNIIAVCTGGNTATGTLPTCAAQNGAQAAIPAERCDTTSALITGGTACTPSGGGSGYETFNVSVVDAPNTSNSNATYYYTGALVQSGTVSQNLVIGGSWCANSSGSALLATNGDCVTSVTAGAFANNSSSACSAFTNSNGTPCGVTLELNTAQANVAVTGASSTLNCASPRLSATLTYTEPSGWAGGAEASSGNSNVYLNVSLSANGNPAQFNGPNIPVFTQSGTSFSANIPTIPISSPGSYTLYATVHSASNPSMILASSTATVSVSYGSGCSNGNILGGGAT